MRITILSGSVPTTTFIDGLINAMADEGFEMTVIGKRTGTYHYHKNVQAIIVPDGFIRRIIFIKLMILTTGFKHLGKIFRASKGWKGFYNDLLFYLPIIRSKPDRIHLQWTAFIHNRDLLFDMFPGKVLVSMRGAHINYTPITTPEIKESYLRLFPYVHRFHAVGETIVKEAEQYGVDRQRTDVIYSYVADELLAKEIIPKETRKELHIISVGRFFWKKGYEYALDALHILKQKGIPFRYTLIAEGNTPPDIIYQLHQLGLTDYVDIQNGATHDEVLKQIEGQDVLLLPSVEEGV
ncbi:MAG: glycosyltransferase, partial [Chitinophagaceae bacterium]|nr:glycosyltransferase [Chitinophagaceae bacterium]